MELSDEALRFVSEAAPEDALVVSKVVGEERLSGLFRFEVELLSRDPQLDLRAILRAPAKLGLHQTRPDGGRSIRWFQGCLAELEELEQGKGWTSYRAVLVPRLWQLGGFYRSRVFQHLAIDGLIQAVLEGSLGFAAGSDFEVHLARTDEGDPKQRAVYPQRDYVVQFEESDLDFLRRWLEHEGVCFWFENDGTAERVVFADSVAHYKPVEAGGATFPYRPSGQTQGAVSSGTVDPQEVTSFRCRVAHHPGAVALNDYNWRTPAVKLSTLHPLPQGGVGVQNQYNDHYKTEAQGRALAEVRAEEWSCRAQVFAGQSTCKSFRPGKTFALDEHFRRDWNASYLLVTVRHEADQAISMEESRVTGANYRNAFTAIPAEQAFRPERLTAWPAIKGTIHGRIDTSEEDGEYAFLNEDGCYKVRLPFDEHVLGEEPPAGGAASRWVRMAQAYAGQDAGLHLPLRPGTEVLLTHIDGDPDRPIIAGAVPDAEHPSPIDSANRTHNTLRTTGGTTITLDDDLTRPGFVMFDAAFSVVKDQRFRRGSPQATPRTPAPGAGGAPGPAARPGRRLNTFGRPRAAAPGPGAGLPRETFSKEAEAEEAESIREAYDAFVTGPGFQAVSGEGRFVSKGYGLKYGDEQIKSDLGDLLDQHEHGIKHSDELFEQVIAFEGEAYGSKLDVGLGDLYRVHKGDQYLFHNTDRQVEIITGHHAYEKIDGKLTKEEVHEGDLNLSSLHTGDSAIKEIALGSEAALEVRTGGVTRLGLVLGATQSAEVLVGAQHLGELRVGPKLVTELAVGGVLEMGISIAKKDTLELTVGLQNERGIFVGGQSGLSLVVGPAEETKLFVAAQTEVEVGLAIKNALFVGLASQAEISLCLAGTIDFALFGGFVNEVAIYGGGKAEINACAGAFADLKLIGGLLTEITLAAALIKVDLHKKTIVEIPEKEEVGISHKSTSLQVSRTGLSVSFNGLNIKIN